MVGKAFLQELLGKSVQEICSNPDEGGATFEVDKGT